MSEPRRPPHDEPSAPGGPGPAPPLGRQIAVNSVLNLAARVVYIVGWTLITPFMLSRLGSERFGLWSLLSVVSGLYLTFDFGLAGALTKFVAEYRAKGERRALRSVFTLGGALYLGLSLAFLAALALLREPILTRFRIAPDLRAEAGAALLAAAASYGVLNLYMFLASVLTGLHRLDLWNRISMAVTLLQLAGVWAVLSLGGGVMALFLNTGASLVVGILLTQLTISREAPEIGLARPPFEPGLARRLLRYSGALQVVNAGVLVQFQLDKVLFGAMVSLSAVGNFELGYRVVSALWSAPSLLLPPLLPAVAHLDATGDRARIERLYLRASRFVLAVAFPVAFGVLALAPALYRAWLGPGHDDAAWAARALAAMLGVNILTGVGSAVARGVGRPGLEARYHIVAMVLHVALSLALIPRMGFAGGLWSLVVSTSLASLYFVWLFHRYLAHPIGAFVRGVVVRPLAAAAAAGALAWWVSGLGRSALAAPSRAAELSHLAAGAAAFGVACGALLLATRAVTIAEVRELARLATGRGAGAIAPGTAS